MCVYNYCVCACVNTVIVIEDCECSVIVLVQWNLC